uniref:Uncharacterized protein n=1 Tax=Plectus sambesii TaxID=2011161 RepID=A0A914XI19_9BILA
MLKNFLIVAPRFSTKETQFRDKNATFHQVSQGERVKQELATAKMPRTDEYEKGSHKYSPVQLKPGRELAKDENSKGAEKSGASGVHQHEMDVQKEKGYWKEMKTCAPAVENDSKKKKNEK